MARITCSQLTLIEKRKTSLGGQTLTYTLKRSSRAKHIRLEINVKTGLAVVVPRGCNLNQLPDLLKRKTKWILSKLAKYRRIGLISADKQLKIGDTIPYLGRDLRIVMLPGSTNADDVKIEQGKLMVSLSSATNTLNLALECWYRQQAEKVISQRVQELGARLGLSYGRLCIRSAKTRWGSCSQKGNLNFSWRLIMTPQPVVDYVIIHELAHLRQMNHSKRFWQVVAEYCPQWQQHRRWLKDHEVELAAKLATH